MIYYVIAISAFSGIAVSWGLYGLAAFGFSSMVGTMLACVLGALK